MTIKKSLFFNLFEDISKEFKRQVSKTVLNSHDKISLRELHFSW